MISKWAETGRKSTHSVTKSKQVATYEKQMNVRKWADKNTKNCTESVSEGQPTK